MLPQMEALFTEEALTFSQWIVLMTLREWGHSTQRDWRVISAMTPVSADPHPGRIGLAARSDHPRSGSETDRRVVTRSA